MTMEARDAGGDDGATAAQQSQAAPRLLLRVTAEQLRRASGRLNGSGGDGNFVGFQGAVDYWHYHIDDTRDAGWGCGYRTLQSLVSWLNIQGHCQRTPPTIPQIQDTLVSEGEKPPAFRGSREWIGTVEAGRVLQAWCDVDFRIIELPSGKEAWSQAFIDKLEHHFQHVGSPIMCGGTRDNMSRAILGVESGDDVMQDTRLLIMDPHFIRGEEDERRMCTCVDAALSHLFKKRWLSWRPLSSFEAGSHYNLCCPIPSRQQQQQQQLGVSSTARSHDHAATHDSSDDGGGDAGPFGIVVVASGEDAAADKPPPPSSSSSSAPFGIQVVESGFAQ
ncbi:hypothetical protein PTSG_00954 [Salpingoeca rosetta]|uniref:UFSP1/2/DUB catalytic domain-containing protein n=1 Tax=Salpingoeca rosetta (strain ATCC 50818 / BSB-021) TaxID=946362 RepID=F2TXZ3_SALR5|nr:uncharacterized protein PTSG_00954 [Salpingoeca rosetta]EGD76252.1 hypothetical protein PTSG_00954 [Salpingoeca rosetta]|eukprot:XP_004998427.1 hypothetical protein PTSG_00954 [Salpingoeca rosetta]